MKCRIQWVDRAGNPTPDDNEAIGVAYMVAHVTRRTPYHAPEDDCFVPESDHYPICAEHATRLQRAQYKHWVFEPYDSHSQD